MKNMPVCLPIRLLQKVTIMEDIWEFVSFYGFVGDLFDPDTIGTALYDLREKIAEMQKSHLNETIHQTVNNSVE